MRDWSAPQEVCGSDEDRLSWWGILVITLVVGGFLMSEGIRAAQAWVVATMRRMG
mgnify:CR=1 FL=1